MENTWTETRHGRVAVLTFTRPPRNWMNILSMMELLGHLERLATEGDEVTVVMLTGGVDAYFIAHADLDDLAKLARGEDVGGDLGAWTKALHLLESMPQPTVAAIDGQAWGGGCETALACTMRIASERSHLGQPEVSVGIIPGAGGTQRLPRLVGSAVGAELCLSGRVIQADEALRIGLLNAVLPQAGSGGGTAHAPRRGLAARRPALRRGQRIRCGAPAQRCGSATGVGEGRSWGRTARRLRLGSGRRDSATVAGDDVPHRVGAGTGRQEEGRFSVSVLRDAHPGSWQTASMLFPSGSKTKAP